MPLYLIRFGYTPEEWAQTIKRPEDRREVMGPLAEAIGGKLHGLWYAFGDHDGYALAEAPDNTAVASLVLALTGGGKFRSLSTTVLLTVEETLDALGRAQAFAAVLERPRLPLAGWTPVRSRGSHCGQLWQPQLCVLEEANLRNTRRWAATAAMVPGCSAPPWPRPMPTRSMHPTSNRSPIACGGTTCTA